MKPSKTPKSAITVRTYRELDEFVAAFASGHLNLLILVGPPGTQKSRVLRQAVGSGACWIEGHATPFGIYRRIWECRDQPLVIDDVDGLYGSREGLRLLKCLCQTEPRKTVSWQSNALALAEEGIPREFTTSSTVAIVGNIWKTVDQNVAAVEDRGICIHFEPSPLEVHVRTATWFWDQEIFDFLAAHLSCFSELSMRLYRQAWELKTAGMDWRGFVLSRTLDEKTRLVARLKADPSYATDDERIQAFAALGGGCKQTFYNHVAKLREHVAPPAITLRNTPPKAGLTDDVLINRLRRRFGHHGNS